MPTALLRLLPHAGLALALIGAIWWIDHRAYARAMGDRDAHDARMLSEIHTALRISEQRLGTSIANIAGDYEARRVALSRAAATLQPTLIKEAAHDTRLFDPASGLSPGLLDAINRARATGSCTAATAGRIDCALPATAAGAPSGDR